MTTQSLRFLALTSTTVFSACQMTAFVLYPYFAESMRLPLSSIISSFALGSLLFLWGSPFWSRRSASWGYKKVMGVGLGGLFLTQLVLLLLVLGIPGIDAKGTNIILWSSRILYGLTASAIVPLAQIMMAESSEAQHRMRAITRHSLALHAGRLLGPFLVWFGLLFSAATPLWLCVGILLALGLILVSLQEPERTAPTPRQGLRWYWPTAVQSRLVLSIAFGVTCLVGILQSSLTQHLQVHLQLDAREAAQLTLRFLVASSLLTILVQTIVQAKIKSPWQGTFPAGAVCLCVSSVMLLQFQTEQELWWALPLFAIGLALLTPSYTTALSLQEALSQGQAAGLLAAAHTLGYTAGALMTAGLIAWNLSSLAVGLALSVILLLLTFCLKAHPASDLQPYKRDNR